MCDPLGRGGGGAAQARADQRVAALAADLLWKAPFTSLPGFASRSLVPGCSLVCAPCHIGGLAGNGM